VIIQVAALIAPSGIIDTTVPDKAPEVSHPGESVKLSAAADETTLDGSTATIKLLCVVKNSANGFSPLKSVAGGLCLVLGNCKVWSHSHRLGSQYSQSSKQTKVDEQAIESLAPRVKVLFESLCAPIPLGDVDEEERERKLSQ